MSRGWWKLLPVSYRWSPIDRTSASAYWTVRNSEFYITGNWFPRRGDSGAIGGRSWDGAHGERVLRELITLTMFGIFQFQASNTKSIHKQKFPSTIIVDLKLIHEKPTLKNAQLLVLTNNQANDSSNPTSPFSSFVSLRSSSRISVPVNSTERVTNVQQRLFVIGVRKWRGRNVFFFSATMLTELISSSCTPTFECVEEKQRMDFVHLCANIEQVTPARWSISSSAIDVGLIFIHLSRLDDRAFFKLKVIVTEALRDHPDDYQCQFRSSIHKELYHTNVTSVTSKTVRCVPPVLENISQGKSILDGILVRSLFPAVDKILLSLYDRKSNLTFGQYDLLFVNCSSIHSCSSCSRHPDLCVWHPETITCIAHGQRQPPVTDTHQCPSMYLKPSTQQLSSNAKMTLTIHVEQCHRSLEIQSCRLTNDQKRFIAIDSDPRVTSFDHQDNLCLLSCSFKATDDSQDYEQPFPLDLSIQFANQTSLAVPHTHLSLYHCARLALNCTSCLELDPSYRCIWCNNICMLNEPIVSCANKQQCVQPLIQSIDPAILPVNGGSLVTIQGNHLDLVNVSIQLAGVPCQFNAEESTNEK